LEDEELGCAGREGALPSGPVARRGLGGAACTVSLTSSSSLDESDVSEPLPGARARCARGAGLSGAGEASAAHLLAAGGGAPGAGHESPMGRASTTVISSFFFAPARPAVALREPVAVRDSVAEGLAAVVEAACGVGDGAAAWGSEATTAAAGRGGRPGFG
jgi:hypothetical protein